MNDIIIENLRGRQREFDLCNPQHAYIGRYYRQRLPNITAIPESFLANPFRVTAERSRSQVIAQYKMWLGRKIMERDHHILFELAGLRKLAERAPLHLWCWCAPLECHGNVIRELILSRETL